MSDLGWLQLLDAYATERGLSFKAVLSAVSNSAERKELLSQWRAGASDRVLQGMLDRIIRPRPRGPEDGSSRNGQEQNAV